MWPECRAAQATRHLPWDVRCGRQALTGRQRATAFAAQVVVVAADHPEEGHHDRIKEGEIEQQRDG